MRRTFWTPTACRSSRSPGTPDLIGDLRDAERPAAPSRVKAIDASPPGLLEEALSYFRASAEPGTPRGNSMVWQASSREKVPRSVSRCRKWECRRLRPTLRGASWSRKRRRAAQELANLVSKLAQLTGLHDDRIAEDGPVVRDKLAGKGGHEQHLCLWPDQAQTLGEHPPVHARHHNVRQQHVDRSAVGLGDLQRLFAARRLPNVVAFFPHEEVHRHAEYPRVVIHHENGLRAPLPLQPNGRRSLCVWRQVRGSPLVHDLPGKAQQGRHGAIRWSTGRSAKLQNRARCSATAVYGSTRKSSSGVVRPATRRSCASWAMLKVVRWALSRISSKGACLVMRTASWSSGTQRSATIIRPL